MFILLKNDGTAFYLQNNKTYTVGRKTCDILLNDQSVSRKHALIKIMNKIVYVEDLKSPNGSHLNGSSLKPNHETIFNVGSQIMFGLKDSIFILQKDNLVVTCSGLGREEKTALKTYIYNMGGQLLSSWSKTCTHIVVEDLTLTIKVLSALITQQDIVTTHYFKTRWQQIEKNGYLPDIEDFRPSPSEDKLRKNIKVNFSMDRKRLFKNKLFVFPHTSSKNKLEEVINLAGGKAISFEDNPVSPNEIFQGKTEYLFIITNENTQSAETDFNKCVQFLIENKRRSIPIQEIAMAILVGNCECDCNSNFNRIGHLLSGEKVDINHELLVPETQTQLPTERKLNIVTQVIPDSMDGLHLTPIVSDQDDVKITVEDTKVEILDIEDETKPVKCEEVLEKSRSVEPIIIDDDDVVEVKQKRCGNLLEGTRKKSKIEESPFKMKNDQRKITDLNVKKDEVATLFKSPSQKRKSEDIEESSTKSKTLKSSTKDLLPLPKSQKTSLFNLSIRSKGEIVCNPFSEILNKRTKLSTMAKVESNQTEELKTNPSTSKSINSPALFKMPKTQKDTSNLEKSKENPFISLIKNKTPKKIAEKPEIDTLVKPSIVQDIMTSTRIEEDFAPFEISTVSTLPNTNWLSKTTNDVDQSVSRIEEDLDPKMKEFINSFKTKIVIVKSESLIVRRPMLDLSTNSTNISSMQKNFKKFRKIQPVHMQTTIIPKCNFTKVVCSITGVAKSDSEPEDEDARDIVVPVKKIRNKFNF